MGTRPESDSADAEPTENIAGHPVAPSRSSVTRSSDPGRASVPEPTMVEVGGSTAVRDVVGRELGDRYEHRSILGEGGMGEIRLVWDRRVGREVAMKVLLPGRLESARARERFLREAHVQGFLDHPGIVPVHDVGELPGGEPYFTMKRVRGVTLLSVLEGLRHRDPRIASRFGRRRLLAALAQACLAIDYAHSRGVVHRDLKPENIMIGDFGEVYVLDWGVARMVGTHATRLPPALMVSITRADANILGTPGYMSPEQIDTGDDVDGGADVYALGAILFELLTLTPLHQGKSVRELMVSTRDGVDARPSARVPGLTIPRELDSLCVRATAHDPMKRPTAREMHEVIESFLDGDREADRRRVMAELHLATAKETWKRAREGGPRSAEEQRDAIRGLSRALAADPNNREALGGLVSVLTHPVDRLPPEAAAELDREHEAQRRVTSRALRLARLSWVLFLPLVVWMGVRDWALLGVIGGSGALALAASFAVDRLAAPKPWMRTTVAVLAMLTMVPLGGVFSPIVVLPLMLAVSLPAHLAHLDRRGRLLTTVSAVIAALVPLLTEWLGLSPPTLRFEDGTITILPRLVELPSLPTQVALTVMAIAPLVTAALLMDGVREELDAAQRRIHGHLWKLRQLLPERAHRIRTRPSETGARSTTGSEPGLLSGIERSGIGLKSEAGGSEPGRENSNA